MKKISLLLMLIITAHLSEAQDKSQGKIRYDITINLHAALKPDQQQFKDLIPETATHSETLYFHGNKSKTVLKEMKEMESEEGGAKIKIKTGEDNVEAVYTDGATGKSLQLVNDEGKKSLEEKDGKDFFNAPKPGTRTKKILGFDCKEVIAKSDDGPVTLWITDQLPFRSGPFNFKVKEGAVLEVQSKKVNAVAAVVDYETVTIDDVTPPADLPVKTKK